MRLLLYTGKGGVGKTTTAAATGAIALVIAPVVREHGFDYFIATVILAGALQIVLSVLGVARLMRFVSRSVMVGFVNALAILIFLSQLPHLLGVPALVYPFVVVGVLIMVFLPKLTTAIPAPLIAIVLLTAAVLVFNVDIPNVGDEGELPSSLPALFLPQVPFDSETLAIIFPYALAMALVGLLESLLTAKLVDDITDTHSNKNRESWGQGVANIVTGFFGGMGGCAMIGQSMINIKSGGRGRLSGITAALALILLVVVGSSFIEIIPVAALVGIMFVVVISTFEWSSIRQMKRIPRSDAFIIVLVSLVTVFVDLAVAVFVGVIVSALIFAWKKGSQIEIHSEINQTGSKVYCLRGQLFFGSAHNFLELFTPESDPDDVIIDFHYARVHDNSGIEAINTLAARYARQDKKLHLVDLSPECTKLLDIARDMVDVKVYEDLRHWHIATDKLA